MQQFVPKWSWNVWATDVGSELITRTQSDVAASMWKYQHPDFALFLLGELQKQQQGSVLCDTLLQTEGVCVPAHSCVLAALSPVFSRILSSSPAPHVGQNRLLNLEAVGSHALLKLVGFLYTGEMEIESRSEHERIMAAALRLGLRSLLEKKRVLVKKGFLETGVQTEDCPRSQESEIVPEPLKVQSSTATSNKPQGCTDHELPPSSLFDEANGTEGFNLVSKATGLSLTDRTEGSLSNRRNTKTKKSWKTAKRESQFRRKTRQQTQIKVFNVEGNNFDNSKQIGVVKRSRRVSGKDFQKLLEKKRGISEPKEAKVDQLKVKIKLSRRRGACWESNLLVSVQGESEKAAEEVKECAPQTQICPSGTLPGQSLGTLTPPTDLTISPSNSSTHASSDKCLHTQHHISVSLPLDIPALPSSSPQADESDEQIALLLEDMFMMGLNILPLMPLERNLDEQVQLDPLQDQKGGQRDSTQSTCLFVQGSEPEMRKSDSKKTAPVGSPGERNEDSLGFRNQSTTNAVELLLSPGQDNLNTVNSLETVVRNSDPSLVEGLFLTPKTTAVPDRPSSAADLMACIPTDRPDFKLLQCLSPLESENGDSDAPKQNPSHSQDPEMQNYPSWLSKLPLKLDFPLISMIDFSCPRSWRDHIACQNRSSPDLAERQELKPSCSHNNLTRGSSSNLIQPDVSDATQQPKEREARGRTQRSTANECQNHKNEAEVQPIESKSDDMPTNNARRISARIINANRKIAVDRKRKPDFSSPIRKKRPKKTNASKRHEHVDVVPNRKVTHIAKRRRGRPRKSKIPDAFLCNNESLPSGQGDCEVEKGKTNREIEHGELSDLQDLTEMEMADVNGNSATVNSQVKHTDHAKGPSILDQIFHQTLPSLTSRSCQIIGQQQTSSLRDSSFWLQESRGGKSEDENSKLAANSSEQIDDGICAREKTAGNDEAHKEVSVNQTTPPLPSVEEDVITEINDVHSIPNVQGQMIEISVPLTSVEDIVKDIMMPANDQDTTNQRTVIEVNLCVNSLSEQAEPLKPNSASNEPSSEVTDSEKDIDHGINWVTDCLGNIEEDEDLGTNKGIEMTEGMSEETDVLRAHEFVKEKALLASGDVCWENTSGWDDDNDEINVEEDQCSAETTDGPTPLEDEELNEGRIASPMIADDPSNGVLTVKNTQEIISTDGPCVQTEASSIEKPHVCTEEVSTLLPNSESEEDTPLDEEDIEVDVEVVGSPLGLLAAGQILTLTIESPLDQEDELEDEEEEEVDVTGEETD